MLRRFRKTIRAALVGLGILALSAGTAGAHTQTSFSGWYEWQGWRQAYNWDGGILVGFAKMRTAWRVDGQYPNPFYGFDLAQVGDYTNNGPNDCVEVWSDFNRGAAGGAHRNNTVFRHCNTNGNVWANVHDNVTDQVLHPAYDGWDFAVCRSQNISGWWYRSGCVNELGHSKPMPDESGLNWGSDYNLAGCTSTYWDATWAPGCYIYLHNI